jgi:hypothetical protein
MEDRNGRDTRKKAIKMTNKEMLEIKFKYIVLKVNLSV